MSEGAPSPAFEIPDDISEVFRRFLVTEYAYFTPKGEPLCWPVTPYWYPERGVLAVATGLAYPNKADYPKRNPKVAMLFSDAKGSGLADPPAVLVQGDATVLDQDMQENLDRYVRELREKFPVARLGLNPVSVRLLDFYLPRLWVEITPVRIVSTARDGRVETIGAPLPERAGLDGQEVASSGLDEKEIRALQTVIKSFGEATVTVEGKDGYPVMNRTEVGSDDGAIFLKSTPGAGSASLTFHRHSLGGMRFQAHMARGSVFFSAGGNRFVPSRLVGFFGNGLFFPLSAITEIANLRKRLRKELARRGQPMPQLRIPK